MMKNSLNTSGYFFNSEELLEKINKIFEISDLNNDGKLSFTEFKQAVSKNYIFVNSLWLDPNQIKLNNISNIYFLKNNPKNYYFDSYNKPFDSALKQLENKKGFNKYKLGI